MPSVRALKSPTVRVLAVSDLSNLCRVTIEPCSNVAFMNLPTFEDELTTEKGERGWIGTFHTHTSEDSYDAVPEPVQTRLIDEARIFVSTSFPPGMTKRWTLKLKGYLQKDRDMDFEFGLSVCGRAKVRSVVLPR